MKDKYEEQLDSIRIDLYEKTKGMTNSDAAKTTNENARKIAQKYGITMVQMVNAYIEQ